MLLPLLVTCLFLFSNATIRDETCDQRILEQCVDSVSIIPNLLPRNLVELDAQCEPHQRKFKCVDTWIKRCLPTNAQEFIRDLMGSTWALMRHLCSNDTVLRREFAKETDCWCKVSTDWSRCMDILQILIQNVHDRSVQINSNKELELCSVRDAIISCVVYAGRSCSVAAVNLLKRMAWLIAQDLTTCTQQTGVYSTTTFSFSHGAQS